MDLLLASVFDPHTSLLGRVLAAVGVAVVLIFLFMIRRSMAEQRDSPESQAEERERDARAEALVAQVRREMAEEKRDSGER